MKKTTITVGGQEYTIDARYKDYGIHVRKSSYIAFIGVNSELGCLLIQFNNGHCSVFNRVPDEVLNAAKNAASIGKFFHAEIKGKYQEEVCDPNLITEVKDDDDDDEAFGEAVEERPGDDEIDW